MDSYDPSGDVEFLGILEIHIHNARNIHNICIYDNQDVYAKLSLTYNPDEVLSTRIINGGGKNPEFNEDLIMKVTQFDAVLKCEIWMHSRAKNLMEDQLLGFALVPIPSVVGKGKVTEDFCLSSTDLFHSPAGTVKLTLHLDTNVVVPNVSLFSNSASGSSITSEVVLLDRKKPEVAPDPVEYTRIEFPDISVVKENQQMVSEYFDLARNGSFLRPGLVGSCSFLHLGAADQPVEDYEMAAEGFRADSVSPNGSIQTSGFLSSTMTSLSDDRTSVDSAEKKNHSAADLSNSPNASVTAEAANHSLVVCPDTPTSKKMTEKGPNISPKIEENNNDNNVGKANFGQVFPSPLGNINHLEAEQSAMQQQIVDMYMRSMQQFTESLAKMKLPMDLDKPRDDDHDQPDAILNNHSEKFEQEKKKKKDNSRVFYGSRAFF